VGSLSQPRPATSPTIIGVVWLMKEGPAERPIGARQHSPDLITMRGMFVGPSPPSQPPLSTPHDPSEDPIFGEAAVQLSPMPSTPVLEQANGHVVGPMLGHVGGPVGETSERGMQISNLAPSSE
jgi:hypothetical protein